MKAVTCWHCSGSRECDCPTCLDEEAQKAGKCVACSGVGSVYLSRAEVEYIKEHPESVRGGQ